jgi:hypothetical protein
VKRLGILSNLQAQTPDTTEYADRWREHAACRNVSDPEIFFAIGESPKALQQTEDAKRICHSCPVMDRCLNWAIEHGQDAGVWGGLDEQQRRRLHGRRSSVAGPPKPPRTPTTVLADKSQEVPGGHVVWSGTQPVFVNGEEYTAPQLAWVVAYGERPDGPLTLACDHPGCIRPQHRLDARGRAARHGTRAAYLAHRRRNEEACKECLAANRHEEFRLASAKCGTRGGYQAHRRWKEEACEPCRQANADADRRLRNTGTMTKATAPKPVKVPKPKAIKPPKPKPVPKPKRVAQCGTDSGYRSHRRRGTEICQPCRDAHADVNRRARARWAKASAAARAAAVVPSLPTCGTRTGYDTHVTRGEAPCRPCTEARARTDWLLRTGVTTAA